MELNIPEIRQALLEARLAEGALLHAAELAAEFGVSVDTIRRDLIALEEAGRARRVRGGAVPVKAPDALMRDKVAAGRTPSPGLIAAACEALDGDDAIILEGGSTALALARALPVRPGRVVMTPSPWVAVAAAERGLEVYLIGGRLSPSGGIAVGSAALDEAGALAADATVLGACGIEAEFGLSADDPDEARMKRALAEAGARVLVVAGPHRLGQRARHRALPLAALDLLITDGDEEQTAALRAAGLKVQHG